MEEYQKQVQVRCPFVIKNQIDDPLQWARKLLRALKSTARERLG
jgi:hypothetical protein